VGIQTTHPVCCSLEHPPISTVGLGLRLEFQTNVPEDPRFRVCMYHAPVKPSARIGVMHSGFSWGSIPEKPHKIGAWTAAGWYLGPLLPHPILS
jgi:hypothetical protein